MNGEPLAGRGLGGEEDPRAAIADFRNRLSLY